MTSYEFQNTNPNLNPITATALAELVKRIKSCQYLRGDGTQFIINAPFRAHDQYEVSGEFRAFRSVSRFRIQFYNTTPRHIVDNNLPVLMETISRLFKSYLILVQDNDNPESVWITSSWYGLTLDHSTNTPDTMSNQPLASSDVSGPFVSGHFIAPSTQVLPTQIDALQATVAKSTSSSSSSD